MENVQQAFVQIHKNCKLLQKKVGYDWNNVA